MVLCIETHYIQYFNVTNISISSNPTPYPKSSEVFFGATTFPWSQRSPRSPSHLLTSDKFPEIHNAMFMIERVWEGIKLGWIGVGC